jgi:sugar phosphate isomerase/epimerase
MGTIFRRRDVLKSMISLPVLIIPGSLFGNNKEAAIIKNIKGSYCRLKISLNAFSFNDLLLNGSFSVDDLLEFCADNCFDAIDLTAYYFPGYPEVPSDEFLFHIKRKAFRLGLDISGTGIRNNFTDPDENKRNADISLIKNWIICASKIGAPVIRIFAGQPASDQFSRDQITEWMIKDINECVEFGKNHGIVVALQNHNDFIQNAEQAIKIVEKVNSEWFGLMLDTGSFRQGNPYDEISKAVRYAVNWQIKENVFINGSEEIVDIQKLVGIIQSSGYQGYLPVETLGTGDPQIKTKQLAQRLRDALN